MGKQHFTYRLVLYDYRKQMLSRKTVLKCGAAYWLAVATVYNFSRSHFSSSRVLRVSRDRRFLMAL